MNIKLIQSELLKIPGLSNSIQLDDLSDMMAVSLSSQESAVGEDSVPMEEGYDMKREMQLIDARYRAENTLLDAIADGEEVRAFQAIMDYGMMMRSPAQKAVHICSDPIRDFQNSIHSSNIFP